MDAFLLANSPPFGDGLFTNEPPAGFGINITDIFHIVEPKPDDPGINSTIDTQYPNVAIITHDATNQFGGMWAIEQLDLTTPFSIEMYLHLGHQYGNGGTPADGMTFTLQNDPAGLNAIGGAGEGLGVYRGRKWTGIADYTTVHGTYLRNSLVVEFDTYRNRIADGAYVDDPGAAGTSHCALLVPRADLIYSEDHLNTFYFTPTQEWVRFEAIWAPNDNGGGILDYTFGGIQNIYLVENIISTFGGTRVYWGFTGATGELTSVQAAAITRLPIQELVAVKRVSNEAGMDLDQSAAQPGDIINYTISVMANQIFSEIGPIIIDDMLSEFVTPVGSNALVTTSAGAVYEVGIVFIDNNVIIIDTGHFFTQNGDWLDVTFDVVVALDAGGRIINNSAIITAQGLLEPLETNITQVTIFTLPEKSVSNSSEAGREGSSVTPGDLITYDINFVNFEEFETTVLIIDALAVGVDYVSSTNGGVYDPALHTVNWILPGVPGGAQGTVSFTVRVNELAEIRIEDFATVQVEDNAPLVTNTVVNPVVIMPPVCPPCPPPVCPPPVCPPDNCTPCCDCNCCPCTCCSCQIVIRRGR